MSFILPRTRLISNDFARTVHHVALDIDGDDHLLATRSGSSGFERTAFTFAHARTTLALSGTPRATFTFCGSDGHHLREDHA